MYTLFATDVGLAAHPSTMLHQSMQDGTAELQAEAYAVPVRASHQSADDSELDLATLRQRNEDKLRQLQASTLLNQFLVVSNDTYSLQCGSHGWQMTPGSAVFHCVLSASQTQQHSAVTDECCMS